ncbi:beta-lactamase/transpeptidase-like protein [Colletotrichum phormii]|uniref:Beta-lactamase/transpeptidase-like protein n=1 Tax=Colletotrichum phormii TaxID=359342 RepID=A0AAJ0A4U9_9PEZI|nr:beta-lactamase/transpeptidase-like protein [Colletotrichum phormii]KAK1656495.1 beta-lactamase/transpeptidase-like protein [Colletotrichum phormii]
MRQNLLSVPSAVASLSLIPGILAANPVYQPCPLLRAYYPMPTIDKNAEAVKSFTKDFTTLFDQLVKAGGSEDFGEITPNTTSFSVVLFSGTDEAEEDPVFFEYHYTAPEAPQNSTLHSNTVFPLGTLTQLFTVYAWLVEVGDEQWGKSITEYLPELRDVTTDGMRVKWDDITVGSLAGHLSGLARESYACVLGKSCGRNEFIEKFSNEPPLFLPDTTPIISNAAFQLLALALEANKAEGSGNTVFDIILAASVLEPLNMTNSGLLSSIKDAKVFARDLNVSAIGEPAALSMLSTTSDLARAGHAMLSSRLISPVATRRWLQPVADTSNIRNGVGRPWEIYHAGQYANSSILDVFTKTGLIGHYASYFGLAPDFNAGFAILAHDTEAARGPDLNVYADIISLAVVQLQKFAAAEMAARYVGTFDGLGGLATFNTSRDGPGLLVSTLKAGEADLRAQIAEVAGIKLENLDFRLYPSNVGTKTQHQFGAVFQDKSAPVDMGTPTCITWQDVDSLGSSVDVRLVFTIDASGRAANVTLNGGSLSLARSA